MQLDQATAIAERVKAQLAPHCDRIEIAGSIRRRKSDVGDMRLLRSRSPTTWACSPPASRRL